MNDVATYIISGLSFVAGTAIGYKVDLHKSRVLKLEDDIKAGKLVIIPTLDKWIDASRSSPCPLIIRRGCIGAIGDSYFRFRLNFTGRRRLSLDLAWQALQGIPEADLCGSSGTGVYMASDPAQAAELAKIQAILTPKLESLRTAIYAT